MQPKNVIHINYSVQDLHRILELALKQVMQEQPTNYYTISRLSTDLVALNSNFDELFINVEDGVCEGRSLL